MSDPVIDTIDDVKFILEDGTEIPYIQLADILKELSDPNLIRTKLGRNAHDRPVDLISASLKAAAEAVLIGYVD